jgi:glucose/arabinose dehydrogenase
LRKLNAIMNVSLSHALLLTMLSASCAFAQTQGTDVFRDPIPATEGVIKVNIAEFATLPNSEGMPARMMLMSDEPSTRRLFVNDMRGPLYSVSYDGKTVTKYLDINASNWGVAVQSMGAERGFQSFAFHPQFNQRGSRGYGKFYTYTDTSNMMPTPDFVPGGGNNTHDTVLVEWTAKDPAAATYDGDAPRELFRLRQPFPNHNGGMIGFNPLARPGGDDYGLLYIGIADGGSGGDPLNNAQKLTSMFGKIVRIDPLGSNSSNKKYGIPASNPFVKNADPMVRPEIYASGVRNPQRFGWDSRNGNMFLAEIGQNTVEEISLIKPGGNLGWNVWEASFKFTGRDVDPSQKRADPKVTYPVVEYDHKDPTLLPARQAITGVVVQRSTNIPQLANMVIFGDNPSGEVFYFSADKLPEGGQDFHRVLFNSNGDTKTLLQLIKDKNPQAARADLRFGTGPNGQLLLLNKNDGTIRQVLR